LRSDGTVVATGENIVNQCDVGDWRDIVAISAGTRHTVGLRPNGTVIATGWNKKGECDVGSWRDIGPVDTDKFLQGMHRNTSCTNCGASVESGANFCVKCGKKVHL
jgi:alpha-tubulin suppressor-like RCC1 family protein